MIKYFACILFFVSVLFSTSSAQQYNWQLISSPSGLGINDLAVDLTSSVTVASTVNGVYLSSDNGKSWSHKGSSVKAFRDGVNCAAIHGDTIVVGFNGDSYYSTDAGNSWANDRPDAQPSDLIGVLVFGIDFLKDGRVIAGTSSGIYFSTNLGVTWAQSDLTNFVRKLYIAKGNLFAISQQGLYVSTDNGSSWSINSKTAQDSMLVNDSVLTDIYYSARDSTLYLSSENKGLYKSTNLGTSWNLVTDQNCLKVYALGQLLIINSVSGKILRSKDAGHTWNPVLDDYQTSNFAVSGNAILFGDINGAWRSTDQGNAWLFNTQGLNALTYATLVSPSALLTVTSSGLQRSVDDGQTWENTYRTPYTSLGFTESNNNYYATTQDTIMLSTNEGITWNAIGNHISSGIFFYDIAVNQDTFFCSGFDAAAQQYNIYKSTNKGKNWMDAGLTLDNDDPNQILAFHDTIYVLGISNSFGSTSHIYRSVNNGVDWQEIPVNSDGVFSLIPYKGKILVGTDNGVYPLEKDSLGNVLSPLSLLAIRFFTDGKSLFATTPNGVYQYKDSSNLWVNIGLQGQDMTIINGKDGKLFAFTRIGDLYMANQTNTVRSNGQPSSLDLSIYSINGSSVDFNVISEEAGKLELRVYDDLGRIQGKPVNTEVSIGTQKIIFPANTLKSNVFFYTARLNDKVSSGKFLMIK